MQQKMARATRGDIPANLRSNRFATLLLGALLGAGAHALAQDAYPNRPLSLVVPFDAGSQPDVIARAVAEGLREALGKAVVVQNKSGAAGTIGVEFVARAVADGYTLGFGPPGQFTVQPKLRKNFPYAIRDFDFICQTNAAVFLLVTSAKSPYSTMAEVIDAARRVPGKLNLGTGGQGTSPHLAAEWIARHAGVSFNHVPFRNTSDMYVQLINGSLDLVATTPNAVATRADFKPLVLIADERLSRHPSIPLAREIGFPLASFGSMMGLYAPKGMPAHARLALREACPKVVESALLKSVANTTSTPIAYLDSEHYTARIVEESRELGGLIDQLGMAVK